MPSREDDEGPHTNKLITQVNFRTPQHHVRSLAPLGMTFGRS
jgi:hypothetical protein